MTKYFAILWGALTRQMPIALEDHDGKVTYTVAFDTPFGLRAQRHWPFHMRDVRLGDDGKVINGCYVENWKPL